MADNPEPADIDIAVTEDTFLGDTLSILQPRKGYRAGIDAVLLASSVAAEPEQDLKVLDLGAGVGVVGLAVAARLPKANVLLIEKQPVLVDLARRNVERNALSARVTVESRDIVGDGSKGVPGGAFDYALANPPFFETSSVRTPPNDIKADAHVMPVNALEAWFRLMAHALKPGGLMTVIHRVETLPELLRLSAGRFGALEIQPLHAFAGQAANRVMLRGKKGSRKPLSLLPGLVLHHEDRSYRAEIEQVLRTPVGLDVFGR